MVTMLGIQGQEIHQLYLDLTRLIKNGCCTHTYVVLGNCWHERIDVNRSDGQDAELVSDKGPQATLVPVTATVLPLGSWLWCVPISSWFLQYFHLIILQKRNHTVFSLLWLALFNEHNSLKIHQKCHKNQQLFPCWEARIIIISAQLDFP